MATPKAKATWLGNTRPRSYVLVLPCNANQHLAPASLFHMESKMGRHMETRERLKTEAQAEACSANETLRKRTAHKKAASPQQLLVQATELQPICHPFLIAPSDVHTRH